MPVQRQGILLAVVLLSIAPAIPATLRGFFAQPAPAGVASEIAQALATLPEDAPIDFVMLTPESQAIAQFAGASLAPRPCRYFDSEEAWRRRERAIFFHDARAANAPPGPPPGRAAAVVFIDPRQQPQFRILK